MSRFGVSQCAKCGQTLVEKQMPENVKMEMSSMNKERPVPVWSYTGLVLLVFLILLSKTNSDKHEKNVPIFINDPQKGDVMTIKLGEKEFGLMRIDSLRGDSVYSVLSKYTAEQQTSAYRIILKGDRAFSQEKMTTAKSRIKELYDQKIIVDIYRK